MLKAIAYYPIVGIPLLGVVGMLTFILLVLTASIPLLRARAIVNIPMYWHFRFARASLVFAFAHALLAIIAFF